MMGKNINLPQVISSEGSPKSGSSAGTLSRRNAMTMMTAIVAAPAAALAPLQTQPNRRARADWERLIAAREGAKQAYEQYVANILDPLTQELDRIAPQPEAVFEVRTKGAVVERFCIVPANLHDLDGHVSPAVRKKAAETREAWLAHRSACESLGIQAAFEEYDRLADIKCARERDLIAMPAPDHAALLWKLEFLYGPDAREPNGDGASYCSEWIDYAMFDAHRLLAA